MEIEFGWYGSLILRRRYFKLEIIYLMRENRTRDPKTMVSRDFLSLRPHAKSSIENRSFPFSFFITAFVARYTRELLLQ